MGFFFIIHVISNYIIQFLQFSQNFKSCIYTICNIQQTRKKAHLKGNTKAFALLRGGSKCWVLKLSRVTQHNLLPAPFPPSFHIPKLSISGWDQNSIVSGSGRECDWGGVGLSIRAGQRDHVFVCSKGWLRSTSRQEQTERQNISTLLGSLVRSYFRKHNPSTCVTIFRST